MVKYSGELGKVLKRLSTYLLYTFMGEKTNDYYVFRPEQIRRLVMCYYLPIENFVKEKGVIVI